MHGCHVVDSGVTVSTISASRAPDGSHSAQQPAEGCRSGAKINFVRHTRNRLAGGVSRLLEILVPTHVPLFQKSGNTVCGGKTQLPRHCMPSFFPAGSQFRLHINYGTITQNVRHGHSSTSYSHVHPWRLISKACWYKRRSSHATHGTSHTHARWPIARASPR